MSRDVCVGMLFRPYPSELLPSGFSYPTQIGEVTAGIYPWWFVDAGSEAGTLFWKVRKHDGRNLIPFAKVDDGRGDIACFDGDDTSGDPAVLMLVLDSSGRRYSFPNFASWLEAAMKDAVNSQG